MSKRKQNIIVAISLIMLLVPQVAAMASIPKFIGQDEVEKIVKDISTPEKKATAIKKLIDIVKDDEANIDKRIFVVQKLGQLRAVQAKDMLKKLAERLEWNDASRVLKRSTTLAYWQIRVAQEPTEELQNALMIKLVGDHDPPHSDWEDGWSIDELSSRGIKKALPVIIKNITRRQGPGSKRGGAKIKLCKTKMEFITKYKTRLEALSEALEVQESTDQNQRLRRWAIEELGKLDTDKSRKTLISFAKDLEKKYYDSDFTKLIKKIFPPSKANKPKSDVFSRQAPWHYNRIIQILRDQGMLNKQIEDKGLHPDECFLVDL